MILGLKYFHGLKIPYRNLSLSNCLLNKKGYIRLTDWGVARLLKLREGKIKEFYGKTRYLAPEVV